jgi:TolA-binding protein
MQSQVRAPLGTPTNRRLTSIMLLLAAFAPASGAQEAPDPVKEVDALTQQWTSLEHQKDELRSEWRTQKPVLEQQLALLEREIRELTTLLEATAEQQDEVEQQRLTLLEEQTRLEEEAAAVEASVMQASLALHSLQRSLPPPLVDGWVDELARLDNPVGTVTERFQKLIELLGELDDFDAKVTLNEAVMTLGDGNDHVVKQVYLGLSHGWYVTADQSFAAAGMTGPDGWVWTPVADAAPIAKIVGILEQRVDPDFVSIPFKLNGQLAGAN